MGWQFIYYGLDVSPLCAQRTSKTMFVALLTRLWIEHLARARPRILRYRNNHDLKCRSYVAREQLLEHVIEVVSKNDQKSCTFVAPHASTSTQWHEHGGLTPHIRSAAQQLHFRITSAMDPGTV